MTKSVRSCLPSDALNSAAQILWETNCGAVPVVAADGSLVGMLTDRDICMACYTQGGPLASSSVESAMSKCVYACKAEDSLDRVLEIMAKRQVRRVPVTSQEGRLVGMVALADVARWAQSLRSGRAAACDALVAALADISEARGKVESSVAAE